MKKMKRTVRIKGCAKKMKKTTTPTPPSPGPKPVIHKPPRIALLYSHGRRNCMEPRVRRMYDELTALGLDVFFDGVSLKPGDNINSVVSDVIPSCDVIYVLLTKALLRKVQVALRTKKPDGCGDEYKVWSNEYNLSRVVPVVMEPGLRKSKAWYGPVGLSLGDCIYIDCSTKDEVPEAVNKMATHAHDEAAIMHHHLV